MLTTLSLPKAVMKIVVQRKMVAWKENGGVVGFGTFASSTEQQPWTANTAEPHGRICCHVCGANIRKHQTTCIISSLDKNGSLLAGQDCIAVASVRNSLGRLCGFKSLHVTTTLQHPAVEAVHFPETNAGEMIMPPLWLCMPPELSCNPTVHVVRRGVGTSNPNPSHKPL